MQDSFHKANIAGRPYQMGLGIVTTMQYWMYTDPKTARNVSGSNYCGWVLREELQKIKVKVEQKRYFPLRG